MRTTLITPAQNRRLHQLLNQLGLLDDKAGLVSYFSAKRTTSTKELAEHQAQALIEHLAGLQPPTAAPQRPANDDAANRMRRKLFAIGRAIGWLTGNTSEDLTMNKAKLDAFLTKKSYLKKPLSQYTPAELPKLVSQFEQIEKHVAEQGAGRAVSDLLNSLNITPAPRPRRPRKSDAQ